jgi:DNA repair protein RecO (recombination protein O)
MQDQIILTGMVIKESPIGEYDRRVTLLTKERGKISAFARGARKPNSRFIASTNLFAFGKFTMYEGRSSYNLADVEISNYFEKMREDYDAAIYGMYFLEIADYYTRENNEESELLGLMYQSLKALLNERLDDRLVRHIFEIRSMVIEGEFPGLPGDLEYSKSTLYTAGFIVNEPLESLYTFRVSDEVLSELAQACGILQKRYIDTEFKSLEMLPQ